MKKWWVSWWHRFEHLGGFELHSPWWISGGTLGGSDSICAAIIAPNEEAVRRIVVEAYDKTPPSLGWRFVEERPNDWTPFRDRFPRGEWMQWP